MNSWDLVPDLCIYLCLPGTSPIIKPFTFDSLKIVYKSANLLQKYTL